MILICLTNVADRTALRTAGWLVAITAFLWAAAGMLPLAAEEVTDVATVHAEAQAALNVWQGSATSVLARRLQEWSTTWAGLFLIQGLTSLAMFLLDMVAGRHHLLRRRAASELFWWKIVRQGIVIALPCAALAVSIYLTQLALSIAWRNRFRQGPMEVVLRAITYL